MATTPGPDRERRQSERGRARGPVEFVSVIAVPSIRRRKMDWSLRSALRCSTRLDRRPAPFGLSSLPVGPGVVAIRVSSCTLRNSAPMCTSAAGCHLPFPCIRQSRRGFVGRQLLRRLARPCADGRLCEFLAKALRGATAGRDFSVHSLWKRCRHSRPAAIRVRASDSREHLVWCLELLAEVLVRTTDSQAHASQDCFRAQAAIAGSPDGQDGLPRHHPQNRPRRRSS